MRLDTGIAAITAKATADQMTAAGNVDTGSVTSAGNSCGCGVAAGRVVSSGTGGGVAGSVSSVSAGGGGASGRPGVGSNDVQPAPGISASTHAWASFVETMYSRPSLVPG